MRGLHARRPRTTLRDTSGNLMRKPPSARNFATVTFPKWQTAPEIQGVSFTPCDPAQTRLPTACCASASRLPHALVNVETPPDRSA
ncbi:MAG: hypothetical protein EA339_03670 [Rhodobacteraceae bacterium]|nr:MAG: hypothetical protein EA339_03670 [Paracoccaceae bacterium]